MKFKCHCKNCLDNNLKWDKELIVIDGGKRYYEKCFEAIQLERQSRSKLYKTVKDVYGISTPNGMMLKQIKTFREKYNMTYEGMRLTLLYCQKQSWFTADSKFGVGIIKSQYEKAKQDYIKGLILENKELNKT